MENMMSRGEERSSLAADRPAVRNAARTTTLAWVKLVLLWLAVTVPLLWGAMDALRDVRYLFP
jgi:hypothetical protein